MYASQFKSQEHSFANHTSTSVQALATNWCVIKKLTPLYLKYFLTEFNWERHVNILNQKILICRAKSIRELTFLAPKLVNYSFSTSVTRLSNQCVNLLEYCAVQCAVVAFNFHNLDSTDL